MKNSQSQSSLVNDLRSRGIHDQSILQAMGSVHRDAFVQPDQRHRAYEDNALSIGCGQTISQPFIVALMAQSLMLSSNDRVLDVGTGSGYAAAVMSCVAKQVYSVERHKRLADEASRVLAAEGFDNVQVSVADGINGWAEQAPFDAISVAAATDTIADAWIEQLCVGGRLVVPLHTDEDHQKLTLLTKREDGQVDRSELANVLFVPLLPSVDRE